MWWCLLCLWTNFTMTKCITIIASVQHCSRNDVTFLFWLVRTLVRTFIEFMKKKDASQANSSNGKSVVRWRVISDHEIGCINNFISYMFVWSCDFTDAFRMMKFLRKFFDYYFHLYKFSSLIIRICFATIWKYNEPRVATGFSCATVSLYCLNGFESIQLPCVILESNCVDVQHMSRNHLYDKCRKKRQVS